MDGRGGALLLAHVFVAVLVVPLGILAIRYAQGRLFEFTPRPFGRRFWRFAVGYAVFGMALGVAVGVVERRIELVLQALGMPLLILAQWLTRPWEPAWFERQSARSKRIVVVVYVVALTMTLVSFAVWIGESAGRRAARG